MRRSIPSPLLFITAIILDRVVISSSQIGLNQSLRALFILLLAASLAVLIVYYFIRDWHHTQFIVLMVPVTLLTYRSFYSFLKTSLPLHATDLGIGLMILLGILYALIVHRRVWKSVRNPAQVTSYFNIVFLALLCFQIVRLGQGGYDRFIHMGDAQASAIPVLDSELTLERGASPDIYVIVLDGYARQDVLEKIYQHDNSEFIARLQKRGFYVASDNHSNYIQTAYSMASFWNMEYIQPWDSSSEYARYLFDPIQNNRIFRSLDEIGYTTVSMEGGLHYTEIKNSDVYLSNSLPLNNFETLLLSDSPLEPLSDVFDLGIPLNTYKTHHQRIRYQLDTLKKIPAEVSGPKIVYTHILAPHPPFVFDENGNIQQHQNPFTLAEGASYQSSVEEYWNGYREQVRFVNREIINVIDDILLKSETPPIILIMGDHGPASMFNWSLEDPGCVWERTSNLYAILLPEHQNDGTAYASISPVNTFRVIFNTSFGTDLPLLEDRSYMMSWQQPTLNVDVTDTRDSYAGCTIPTD